MIVVVCHLHLTLLNGRHLVGDGCILGLHGTIGSRSWVIAGGACKHH